MIATGGYVVAITGILFMKDLSRFECRECAEKLYGTPIERARGNTAEGHLYIECRCCGKKNYFI